MRYTRLGKIGLNVSVLAQGLTGGRMTTDTSFPSDDWRSHSPDFAGDRFHRNLDVVARLRQLAAERGIPLPQLAAAWTIHNPAVDVAIVGARRASQLDTLTPATDVQLSADDVKAISAILANAAPVSGPAPEGM